MLESKLEEKMKLLVEARGGKFLKLYVPGQNGIPDRLMLMPGGQSVFVELKQKGERPRKLQQYQHRKLRADGFGVHVIDDVHQAEMLVALYGD